MSEPKLERRPGSEEEVERQVQRMTRRSFAWGAAAALAGFAGWGWLRTRGDDGGIPWPLRRILEFNEGLGRASFNDAWLAPTFPVERAREPRVNGRIGLGESFDPTKWSLRVEGQGEKVVTLRLGLDDIKALPRTEMVTELKCIEGWSEVVQWAGARFADFAAKYGPAVGAGTLAGTERKPKGRCDYVGLETPNGEYYVGLDIESALHPQTLLCYEMNGQSLTPAHGAPLRLFTPVKYGIKSIKRIGTIRFTNQRPADYWAERGYDWYAGH